MSANQDEGLRSGSPDSQGSLAHPVVLQGVQARDTDEPRLRAANPRIQTRPEAQVGHRGLVTLRAKRRPNIFETERLHPEERPEAETLVSGVRPEQENSHSRHRSFIGFGIRAAPVAAPSIRPRTSHRPGHTQ